MLLHALFAVKWKVRRGCEIASFKTSLFCDSNEFQTFEVECLCRFCSHLMILELSDHLSLASFYLMKEFLPWEFVIAMRRSLHGDEVACREGGLVLDAGL